MKSHFGDSRVTWQKITDTDASEAKILEAKEPMRRGVGVKPERIWRCTKCIDLPGDPGNMTIEGMRDHHDMECVVFSFRQTRTNKYFRHCKPGDGIEQGEDYYRALECPPKQPLVVKIIPKEAPDTARKPLDGQKL